MAVASLPKLSDYGGYDNDFVNDVPDRLVCSTVCTKVLRDPHLTSCCGQHFCASCLESWFDKHRDQSCPHCRAKGKEFSHILDKKLKREISELKVRCSNKDKGCEWTGELQSLEKHLTSEDGCGYVQVECPNSKAFQRSFMSLLFDDCPNCADVLRKDLNGHLKNTCNFRFVLCKYCGRKLENYKIKQHHSNCAKYPLDCPNKCGKWTISREDLPAHCEKCPLEPVTCPFAEAGCEAKVVRRELDKHLADNQQVHLLKLVADYMKVKTEVEKKEQQLETELEITKRALTIQSNRLESMQLTISEDVDQLSRASRTDYECILRSIKTNLESVKNRIDLKGVEHGVTLTMPSKQYFEHSTEWYSPAFRVMGFKVCLQVQMTLLGLGYLNWSLVGLEACTVKGLCRYWLCTQVTKHDIMQFQLPCMLQSNKFSTIALNEKDATKPTTASSLMTIYLIDGENSCLCTCGDDSDSISEPSPCSSDSEFESI